MLRADFPFLNKDPVANTISNFGRNCSESSTAIRSRKIRLDVNNTVNGFRRFGTEEDDFRIGSRWRMLRSLTSGVFCAFLNQNTVQSSPFNFIRSSRSTAPSMRQIAQYFSAESVCTENIDAWLKLIPHLSSGSAPHTEAHLKSLIWRDWILHSPWHSLSFEAKDSEEIMVIDENNRNTCDIKGQQNGNCNTDKAKKEKMKTKSVMSLNLTISAVLLPNILPSHADVLLQLKEHVTLRSQRHRQTGLTTYSSDSENDGKIRQDRKIDKELHGGVLNLDNIRLHRQVSDSRERDFYVHMSVKDFSLDGIRRRCSASDLVDGMRGGKHVATGRRVNYADREGEVVEKREEDREEKVEREVEIDEERVEERDEEREGPSCTLRVGHSTQVHVVELLPPFYEILLNTYTYIIRNSSSNEETHGHGTAHTLQYVADLPSFLYTPSGLSDEDCYDHDVESSSRSSFGSMRADMSGDRSLSCFGSISWTVDLHSGAYLVSSFTAEKRYLHREDYPSDASRGLVVPPAFVVLTSYPLLSK